jgi:hypothetical protein
MLALTTLMYQNRNRLNRLNESNGFSLNMICTICVEHDMAITYRYFESHCPIYIIDNLIDVPTNAELQKSMFKTKYTDMAVVLGV